MEAYEPGKCPKCGARIPMHLKRTQQRHLNSAKEVGVHISPSLHRTCLDLAGLVSTKHTVRLQHGWDGAFGPSAVIRRQPVHLARAVG
jgi:hypothetical protein